jgi:DNA invertase Pin-like site-specific DNA recombinase
MEQHLEPAAASYERKSTADPLGIDGQYVVNAQCAARDGRRIPDDPQYRFSDDETSGTTVSRPGLDRLLDVVRSGAAPFRWVYVKDKTRLGRWEDPRMCFWLEMELKRHGVEIRYSEEETPIDYDGDPSRYMGQYVKSAVDSVVASAERRRLIQRITVGKRDRGRIGCFPGANAPYGFDRWLADRTTRQLIERVVPGAPVRRSGCVYLLRPATDGSAQIVQEIFKAAEQGRSLQRIATGLNDRGIPSPARRRGIRRNTLWTGKVVGKVLQNPLYKGDLVWGRTKRAAFGAPVRATEAEFAVTRQAIIFENFLDDPLVSRENWDAVQTHLAGVRRTCIGRRAAKPAYLLSGLIYCAQCGGHLNGHTASPSAKRRRYYKHDRRTDAQKKCATKATYVSAPALEELVIQRVRDWLTDGRLIDVLRTEVRRLVTADDHSRREKEIAEHEAVISRQSKTQMDAAKRAILAENASEKSAYEAVARDLGGEIEAHRAALEQLRAQHDLAQLASERLEASAETWLTPSTLFEAGTDVERRDIIRALIERIDLTLDIGSCEVVVRGP